MITVIAKFQAAPGKEEELKTVFTEMVAQVKQNESGKALVYSLHVSDSDPASLMFYEVYSSAEAQAAHGTTDHMKAMIGKLSGLLAGRPVIERWTKVAGV